MSDRGVGGRTLRRIVVAVTGGAVLVTGVIAIFLPAPGVLLIFLGLAILATEFEWAGRIHRRATEHLARIVRWLKPRPA